MSRDDVYPVKTSKVGCLLHYVIAELGRSVTDNRPWTSLLDIPHPDALHAPLAVTTVFSTPDDGCRKRPKHIECSCSC